MASVDHRLARVLGVRSGEGRLATHVALVFAVVEVGPRIRVRSASMR